MDHPRYPEWGSFQWGSATNPDGTGPAVYVFEDNDVPNIGNNGVPEITAKFRSSFGPEPQ